MATPDPAAGASWRRAWRAAAAIGRGLVRVVQAVVAVTVLGGLCVGLPWALVRFVGWPLPDHVPSLDELSALLITPMSTSFFLDALACFTWLVWVFFALDLAGCVLDLARGARWPDLAAQAGPLRRVATVLVGALLVGLLSRTAIAAPATSAAPEGHRGVVATAVQHPPEPEPAADPAGTERVREPRDGIHDSLYRVAQRCLGDGDRWPEIWTLNQGSAQPGGRTLTTPSLVHPGDLLRLPPTSAAPDRPAVPITPPPPQPAPSPPPPSEAATPPMPSANTLDSSAHDHPAVPSRPADPVGSVEWGTEVFVGLGLAAAVSAALVVVRRRHRARYRPGSGRRGDDLPVAPVVYQLHQAHLHAQHHDDDADLAAETHRAVPDGEHADLEPAKAPQATATSVRVLPRHRRRILGHDDPRTEVSGSPRRAVAPDIALSTATATEPPSGGSEHDEAGTFALDLAHAHGLGLVGPGGYAAARALLLTVLTSTPAVTVFVPAADLTRLLGVPYRASDLPDAIRVVDDLAAALADLEPHLRASAEDASTGERVVLVTSPPRDDEPRARLQALLDTGTRTGITALILGQWRPGVTAYVTADGTIAATDPGLGEPLRGTRAFTLPDTAARDLLAALRGRDALAPAAPAARADAAQSALPAPPDEPGSARDTDIGQTDAAGGQRGVASPGLEITATPSTGTATNAGRDLRAERPAPGEGRFSTANGQSAPLALSVFGAPTLTWRRDGTGPGHVEISSGFSPRLTELLVFLAVHPGGVSRDTVVDALWAEHAPRDPAGVLRTVLSRIRRAVEQNTGGALSEIVLADRGRYQLAAELVEVDYWAFAAALTRRRTATTDQARTAASEAIVAAYGGALADGLDADWLTAAREATRRDALDAVAALARAHVHDNPDSTLDLLETARAFDPHNELLYRDIMRLEHTLGRHDAISRTLTLLETRLREIDATPTPATVDLATRLRDLHTDITTPAPQPAAPHDRHGQ